MVVKSTQLVGVALVVGVSSLNDQTITPNCSLN